ncbi:MAG: class I SAM-dependent methyltransferase [Solirubrobacterales bacterium]
MPRFIERKRLPEYLDGVLRATGISPSGQIVELGSGICWASACLARHQGVTKVAAIEFSRRRLEALAPIAIAHLGAPPEKIERVVADFHNPGLPPGCADLVVTDAAFHHSADPERLASTCFSLLRPHGRVLLMREPTLSLLRRTRDHGIEDLHGDFEREYRRGEYEGLLAGAGFRAVQSVGAPGDLGTRRGRGGAR